MVETLVERITNYLELGGLFNPELMDHQKVSELLIDCRSALTEAQATIERLEKADKEWGRLHQRVIEERAEVLREVERLEKERGALLQEESCHDEELHGWEQDFEQERKLREAAEAENARLRNSLHAFGFDATLLDEKVGWRGTHPKPSTDAHLRCEFCGAEHVNVDEIEHTEDCPVSIARTALGGPHDQGEDRSMANALNGDQT